MPVNGFINQIVVWVIRAQKLQVGYLPWLEFGRHPLRSPTWAYKWDVVSEMTSNVDTMYMKYMNEFDALTPEQVNLCLYITS